jgi:4-hydroxythreonine-4-phosphate dehydrogenase
MESGSRERRPVIAVTMGDPAGVGAEVIVKALAAPELRRACRPLVLGDWGVLERAAERCGVEGYRFVRWRPGAPLPRDGGRVALYPLTRLGAASAQPGSPSKACGAAAYRYIAAAVTLVRRGQADAIATAPINKKILNLAGYRYPGHTELLAKLTGARECRMMVLNRQLKVILATVHLPLARVAAVLTRGRVCRTLELGHEALRRHFGIARPRLAVAALNPHGGEEGMFGLEERRIIAPAIDSARRSGIDARGPFPADSLFHHSLNGSFDAVVCMYHDQGLIPLKLLSFFGAVTFTLGLPLIRTSVDHGTAYDIAGTGRADASSMREALLLAARLVEQTREEKP